MNYAAACGLFYGEVTKLLKIADFLKKTHLTAVLVLIIFWWILAGVINKPILPVPAQAFAAFLAALQGGLLRHIGISLFRVVVSMLIATLTGVPLGLFLGKNKEWDRKIAPYVYITYPIPKVVFMPVLFVVLGIGDISKILLITLIVFFQILVTTRDAAKNIDLSYLLSVKSLGSGFWELYKHVFFPACLPEILTSLRIGLGTALAVLFLTETYATQKGIGYFIMDAFSRMAYEEMFAGIMAMGLLGFILYYLLDKLEKKLCPWK
ncbi:MAG: ABC transporter permease [Peptococcaceae bacterium]